MSDNTGKKQEAGVLKNSAVMASGTIISRVTGLFRDISLVAALGFGTLSDAYSLGNTLPNIIYILVVGGALNAVFVPQLVRHITEDADRGDGYADRLLTITGLILLLLSVLSVIAAPWIVSLYAPDNYSSTDFDVAVAFTRFCLPQIFFYGMYTMLSQVLNSRGHFAMPMFAPIVNNILVIAVAWGFLFVVGAGATTDTITSGQIAWLGIGTTMGIVLQALVLLPVLGKVAYRYRPKWDFRGYGLGKAGGLAGWTIGLVLVNQAGFVVTTRLATAANVDASIAGVVEQGLTTYTKAYLVFMLPQSVITVSIVTALLPRLSRSASAGRLGEVATGVSNGVRVVASLIIPSAVLLIALGPIVTSLIFNIGAGAGAAATYTGIVVSTFALGLLPFSVFYMLLRGWYSVEDTRTPFIATIIFNVILMGFTFPLYYTVGPAHKIQALALAYALAYWVTIGITWWMLTRRLGSLDGRHVAATVGKMLIAGITAGVTGWATAWALHEGAKRTIDPNIPSSFAGYPLLAIVGLGVASLIIFAVYVIVSRFLGITEVTTMVMRISKRLPILRRFTT